MITARHCYVYLAGLTVSSIGSQVTILALPWAVLSATRSAAAVSVVLLGESIPFATAGFALGPLLDQLPIRTSLIGSDCLRGFAVTVAGLLVLTHHVKIPAFIAIGFLTGCGQVISNATRTASVPLLATAGRQGIIQLNARIKTIRGAATLLGPPLGGFLVATVGAASALFLDAFSYGFAASCSLWAFQLLPRYPTAQIDKGPGYIAHVRHGLRFIFKHRLLRILVIQSATSNMLLTPLTGIILTILAKESWHSSRELGIVLGAIGLGALAGGIAISSRPALVPGIQRYGLLVLGASLPFCAFLTGNFHLMVTGAFIAGIANIFANTAGDTAMQHAVPADLRGRVFAPVVSALAGVVPIGIAAAGSAISAFGVVTTVRAALLLSTAVGLVVTPVLWRLGSADITAKPTGKPIQEDNPVPGPPDPRSTGP